MSEPTEPTPTDGPEPTEPTQVDAPYVELLSTEDVAKEVKDGKWGVRKARRDRLIAAGYNYKAVMREVAKL